VQGAGRPFVARQRSCAADGGAETAVTIFREDASRRPNVQAVARQQLERAKGIGSKS
jgi:hypothetical protein